MKNSYLCPKSELRQFLDAHNITIDLSKHFLSYAGNKYDIEFGSCPKSNTKEFCCWSVGRKFYYDFSICGFLSIWDISPYGGLVHARPEVLMNLDKLLNLSLSREWANTHTPYQVTAKAPMNSKMQCIRMNFQVFATHGSESLQSKWVSAAMIPGVHRCMRSTESMQISR